MSSKLDGSVGGVIGEAQQATAVQRSDDRRDPFEVLPLEVMIIIMQHGLEKDRYFALRNSWVSKLWRSTLNDSCPGLWGTFTTSARDMKKKSNSDKRKAWVLRSAGRFIIVRLDKLTLGNIGRLPKSLAKQFQSVQHLSIEGQTPSVIQRFVKTHTPDIAFPRLKYLTIKGSVDREGRRVHNRMRGEIPAGQPIHCDIIGPAAREVLESLTVESMYYQRGESVVAGRTIAPLEIHRFPALKELRVRDCVMDYSYPSSRPLAAGEGEYQHDPVHDLLRGADQLESLEISLFPSLDSDIRNRVPQPQRSRRVQMPHLSSATIPPPAVWAIDFLAPQLESLILATEFHRSDVPLVPDFEETPVPFERIGKLKVVELVCDGADYIAPLKAWLVQLDSVTKLAVRNLQPHNNVPENHQYESESESGAGDVSQDDHDPDFGQDNRASMRLTKLLADSPELCPKMTELQFHGCYTNGKSLIDWLRKRKALKECANIDRIVLHPTTPLSRKALAALQAEVRVVDYRPRPWGCKGRRHQNDDFEFEIPGEVPSESVHECDCLYPAS